LYNTLCEYDDPQALQTRIRLNTVVMTLFNKEKPAGEWKGADSRFDAACSLAVELL
jgi:hypothetical protein